MKSGTIAVTTTDDAQEAVAASEPLTATLGAVAVASMKAAPSNVTVVVDFFARKVFTLEPGASATGAIGEATMTDGLALTPDDETGASRAFSSTDIGTPDASLKSAIAALIATRKPKLSVAQVVGGIEDALEQEGLTGFAVIDQNNAIVTIYPGTPEVIEDKSDAFATAAAAADIAVFTQTVTEASGGTKPFGE